MTCPTDAFELIEGMRRRLEDPSRWTKGFSARTNSGTACDPCSPAANCWCLYGSMTAEAAGIPDTETRINIEEEAEAILLTVVRHERPALEALSPFNDDRETTHADVLTVLDQALSLKLSMKA